MITGTTAWSRKRRRGCCGSRGRRGVGGKGIVLIDDLKVGLLKRNDLELKEITLFGTIY